MGVVSSDRANEGWLPILKIGDDKWYGVVNGTTLWIGDDQAPRHRIDVDSPVSLLPVLEKSYDSVMHEIDLVEHQLEFQTGELSKAFPLAFLSEVAINISSDYWLGLALNWVEQHEELKPNDGVLQKARDGNWASQTNRHRVRRLMSDDHD